MNPMRVLTLAGACLLAVVAFHRPLWAADGQVLPLPAEDQRNSPTHLGAGVVGKALPSEPIGDPSEYFPLQERSHSYLVTAGKNAGQTQTLPVAKRNRPGGTLAWRAALSPPPLSAKPNPAI